jgi:hypothetical protein
MSPVRDVTPILCGTTARDWRANVIIRPSHRIRGVRRCARRIGTTVIALPAEQPPAWRR